MQNATVLFSASALLLSAFAATAEQPYHYLCRHGQTERQISVLYPAQPAEFACEVLYHKGETSKTLWHARHDISYCDQQAADFAEKQKGWGFDCEKVVEQTAMAVEPKTQEEASSVEPAPKNESKEAEASSSSETDSAAMPAGSSSAEPSVTAQ